MEIAGTFWIVADMIINSPIFRDGRSLDGSGFMVLDRLVMPGGNFEKRSRSGSSR